MIISPEAIRRRNDIVETLRMFELNLPRLAPNSPARKYIIDTTPEYINYLKACREREIARSAESWYYYNFPFKKKR